MWREYLGFVTTAIAVINGLLAIIVALLPVRRSVAKLRLGVVALVLGAAAVGATFYLKHDARVQDERQQADRREVRERLETFTLEGRTLLGQIRDMQRQLPTKPADEWAQRAEIYLRDKLGERYVARFRKDVNDMYGDAAVPAARLGYWRAVRNRVVNLEMITAELPEQPPPPPAPSPPAPPSPQ
jgi:type II secretory pathway pseudopilin PulG